ncbi:MAG: SPOR protein [Magnetococcales bacterium]|nr:SPOR protein [Magnetococcales bacterium]
MNRIRIFLVLVLSLSACALPSVVERLALFAPEPPPKVGITDGTLAVLPFRGHQEQFLALQGHTLDFFRRVTTMNHDVSWVGQPLLGEDQLFGEATADQLRGLGVQWLLTGRYQQPPKGFFTLEVIQVGDQYPFWMFGIPWTEQDQGVDVAERALQRFAEKMGLKERKIVFPVLRDGRFYLPASGQPALAQIAGRKIVQPPPGGIQPANMASESPVEKENTVTVVSNDSAPSRSLDVATWIVEPTEPPPQDDADRGVDGKKERYVLQVGIFPEVEKARDMVQELRKRGYEPEVAELAGDQVNPAVWRVWVGLYDDYPEAREHAREFMVKESLPIHVSLQTNRMAMFRYAVQVGSFLDPNRARDLSISLRAKGYGATIQESGDTSGRIWHSVWIGRYWDLDQARGVAKIFRDKEGMAVFVTPVDAYHFIRMLDNEVVISQAVVDVGPRESVPVRHGEMVPGKKVRQPFGYAVQVGSFTEEPRALALVEHLRVRGYSPRIVSNKDGQGRVWRMVWIGRFHGFSKARRFRDNYRFREAQQAFVTVIPAM